MSDRTGASPVPGFFTTAFHKDFFLPLLVRAARGQAAGSRSPFEAHVPLELPVLFVASIVAVVIGFPAWQAHGSILGAAAAVAGAAGVLALLVHSIGTPPSRDDLWAGFMAPTFAVCVFLGLTIGLFTGALLWKTALAKCAGAGAGLVAGYVVGIGAGLAMQWLGWVGRLLQAFAIPAIVGLSVLDIVLVVI